MRTGCFASTIVVVAAVTVARADSVNLPMTIRDFTPQTNPDFEYNIADDRNMVATALGLDHKPVYNGPSGGTFTTHGPATFNQWYNDTSGVNLTTVQMLTLDNGLSGPGGVYHYSNNSFFPIDGQLFGDYPGYGHNFHFTVELHAQFTHQPGLNFSFVGDDDLWVFINHQRVIDLGGIHAPEGASVNLDTLGLTPGQVYDFDLFFAERHTTGSNFTIDTSITLVPAPASLALLAAAGLRLRRRR